MLIMIKYTAHLSLRNPAGPTRCTGATTGSIPPLCLATGLRQTCAAIAPTKVPGMICSRLVANKPRVIFGLSVTLGGFCGFPTRTPNVSSRGKPATSRHCFYSPHRSAGRSNEDPTSARGLHIQTYLADRATNAEHPPKLR